MEYRSLGQSGIRVSELAFGAWAIGGWLWGGADSKAVKGRRESVQILTKFGLTWKDKKGEFFMRSSDNAGNDIIVNSCSSKEVVISDCDESLRRLGTDYIDLYQIHWPDKETPISETMEALEILISKGKIRAGAVCNYTKKQMSEAEQTLSIASNQMPYSMVHRDIEKEIVPHCLSNNIGILAYSPLQRGILTGKFRQGHKFNKGDSRPDSPYYREPNFSKIVELTDDLKIIADDLKITLSQLVLNWTMLQPGITCVLAGARNSAQVLENVKAADFHLSVADIGRINELLSTLKLEKVMLKK
jgi:aryl-alcohol dehydrogenase-like predicted oxidoreductase